MKILPVGTKPDSQPEWHEEANSHFSQFCKCAKKWNLWYSSIHLLCIRNIKHVIYMGRMMEFFPNKYLEIYYEN